MRRIIIFENDCISLRLIAHLLRAIGYEITSYNFADTQKRILYGMTGDLVLVDLDMEDDQGQALIDKMRHPGHLDPSTQILVMSEHASRLSVLKAIKSGANAYVSKQGFDISDFIEKIKEMAGFEKSQVPAGADFLAGIDPTPANGSGAKNAGPEYSNEERADILEAAHPAHEWNKEQGAEDEKPSDSWDHEESSDGQGASNQWDKEKSSETGSSGAPAGDQSEITDQSPEESAADQEPSDPPRDAIYRIPDTEVFGECFEGLLGRTVTVTQIDPIPFDLRDKLVVASYKNDEGEVSIVMVCDVAIVCYCASALSMIPAATATESKRMRDISGEIQENFHEIANIAASVFNTPDVSATRLAEFIVTPEKSIDDSIQFLLDSPAARMDYELDIVKYGKGKITVLVN